MKTLVLLLLTMAGAHCGPICRSSSAQEEFTSTCETFWNAWAKHEFDPAIEVSGVPFLYFDGKTITTSTDDKLLSKQLRSIRQDSKIGSEISVNVKKEMSFDEIPIDSYRMSDGDRATLKEFFNDDDNVIYVELKNTDGNKRDMFVVILRWFNGKPKVIGIFH